MTWWNRYVGIPFASRGRELSACDCYGLLRLVYSAELGIELPELLDYENTMARRTMAELVRTQPLLIGFEPVAIEEVAPFDVLVLRNGGFDCHLAIVIDARNMLHTESGKGVIVEGYHRPHIKPRLREAWRYVR